MEKQNAASPEDGWPQERGRFKQWKFDVFAATARQGLVPKHIAFIVDGNRRWGRRQGLPLKETYLTGWARLITSVEFCLKCGVKAMSAYVFSTENYRRSEKEVTLLMDIVMTEMDSLVQLLQHLDISLRLCGQRELTWPNVLAKLEDAVQKTEQNKTGILNLCFAYASTAEMAKSMQASIQERLSDDGDTYEASASETQHSATSNTVELLKKHMYTADSPPLDLLIRTGKTHRLSDFLLWQCHERTSIVFVDKSWPDLSIPRVVAILLEWRCRQKKRLEESQTPCTANNSVTVIT